MRLIVMFFLVFSISSCAHEEIIDTSLQVGSIYCSDGSIIHPNDLAGSNKNPVGVIFWVNDGNPNIKEMGFAVALEDLAVGSLVNSEIDIQNVSTDEHLFNGAANTSAIYHFAMKDSIEAPAVFNAINYTPYGVTGWFIGSVAEAKEIHKNIADIYDTFNVIGGEHFDGWYWTSTQDGSGSDSPKFFAMVVSLHEGRATTASKSNINKVRPIIGVR